MAVFSVPAWVSDFCAAPSDLFAGSADAAFGAFAKSGADRGIGTSALRAVRFSFIGGIGTPAAALGAAACAGGFAGSGTSLAVLVAVFVADLLFAGASDTAAVSLRSVFLSAGNGFVLADFGAGATSLLETFSAGVEFRAALCPFTGGGGSTATFGIGAMTVGAGAAVSLLLSAGLSLNDCGIGTTTCSCAVASIGAATTTASSAPANNRPALFLLISFNSKRNAHRYMRALTTRRARLPNGLCIMRLAARAHR